MCKAEALQGTPLDVFIRAITRYVGEPKLELTAAELGEHLIRLRHGIDLLELDFAMGAATFASTDEYEAQGSITPIDWIRHHCKMTGHTAARSVAAGEQVGRLPATSMALAAGDIGFAHFSLLAGVARALSTQPAGATDEGEGEVPESPKSFDERPLLELAREHSVGRFGHDCINARHAHDAAAVLEEHVSAAERNRCEFIPCEGGFLALRGYFDPIAAATIKTAVFPLSRRAGVGDDRPRARRLADALVEIAGHALDLGAVPTTGGASTHFQLTASVETVMGLEGAPGGDLELAGVVPAATVQRLACDARVRRILLGPNSAVIDVGRARRLPGPAARAALRARSGGCEWPGCDRPVAFTNVHHFVHWGHSGVSDVPNLVLLKSQ
jgi:Domain of unknown function (DUF222)